MKTFKLVAAQGEITVRRVGGVPKNKAFPKGYVPMKAEVGNYIIGHSETGHHHVVDAEAGSVAVLERPPEGMKVLRMILENPASIEHLRGHDTHESIVCEPGEYEIRIAREFDHYQELARQSVD